MKRRGFLKTLAGVVGAVAAGLKVKPTTAPVPAPPMTFAEIAHPVFTPAPRWIVDEWCPPDRIYLICTQAQQEAYGRLGRNLGTIKLDETS